MMGLGFLGSGVGGNLLLMILNLLVLVLFFIVESLNLKFIFIFVLYFLDLLYVIVFDGWMWWFLFFLVFGFELNIDLMMVISFFLVYFSFGFISLFSIDWFVFVSFFGIYWFVLIINVKILVDVFLYVGEVKFYYFFNVFFMVGKDSLFVVDYGFFYDLSFIFVLDLFF